MLGDMEGATILVKFDPNTDTADCVPGDISSCADTSALPVVDGNLPVAGDLLFDGSNIWLADHFGGTLHQFRRSDGELLQTVFVGGLLREMAFDGTHIWVTQISLNSVAKVRVSDGVVLGSYPVGTNPYVLEFDGTSIWVGYSGEGGNGGITRLRLSDGEVIQTIPGLGSIYTMLFEGDSLWVGSSNHPSWESYVEGVFLRKYSTLDSSLQAEFSSGDVFNLESSGEGVYALEFDGKHVWYVAAKQQGGEDMNVLVKLRASDGEIIGVNGPTSRFVLHPVALLYGDGFLWTYNGGGGDPCCTWTKRWPD